MSSGNLKTNIICANILISISDEDIDDIMATALGGGITYWCGQVKVEGEYLGELASDQISRGGVLHLHDTEEDWWDTLDKEKFVRGLSLYIVGIGLQNLTIKGGKLSLDCSKIDAAEADCIVQLAIFGDIIYG